MIIGIDPHKMSHTATAVDPTTEVPRFLGHGVQETGASSAGWEPYVAGTGTSVDTPQYVADVSPVAVMTNQMPSRYTAKSVLPSPS